MNSLIRLLKIAETLSNSGEIEAFNSFCVQFDAFVKKDIIKNAHYEAKNDGTTPNPLRRNLDYDAWENSPYYGNVAEFLKKFPGGIKDWLNWRNKTEKERFQMWDSKKIKERKSHLELIMKEAEIENKMLSRKEKIEMLMKEAEEKEKNVLSWSKEDEEMAKELLGKEEQEPKKVEPKKVELPLKKEPKKEPITTHREISPQTNLFDTEIIGPKITGGEVVGKVCDLCGRFNFPAWKKECGFCKKAYNFIRDLVDSKGMTPAQAIKEIAEGKRTNSSPYGMICENPPPHRATKNKRHYLNKQQLNEIWSKGGKIPLPNKPEDLSKSYEDKRGMIGIPSQIKLQYALETQLNVERVEKEQLDPATGQTRMVSDVSYDKEGIPIPLKYNERDYFTLQDISNKLKMTPQAVLNGIGDYNYRNKSNFKPVVYYDGLNQAFSWKKVIGLVFADRIKELFELAKKSYLNRLSIRKEKLDENIIQAEGSLKMVQKRRERLQNEMGENPNKDKIRKLFDLRKIEIDLKKEEINLVRQNKELSPEDKNTYRILTSQFGDVLDDFTKDMSNTLSTISILKAKIERMKEAREKVLTEAKEYFESLQHVKEVGPSELQKAQTGKESFDENFITAESKEISNRRAHLELIMKEAEIENKMLSRKEKIEMLMKEAEEQEKFAHFEPVGPDNTKDFPKEPHLYSGDMDEFESVKEYIEKRRKSTGQAADDAALSAAKDFVNYYKLLLKGKK